MTDDTKLQAMLDRESIRDLVYRHTDAANRGDLDTGTVLHERPVTRPS